MLCVSVGLRKVNSAIPCKNKPHRTASVATVSQHQPLDKNADIRESEQEERKPAQMDHLQRKVDRSTKRSTSSSSGRISHNTKKYRPVRLRHTAFREANFNPEKMGNNHDHRFAILSMGVHYAVCFAPPLWIPITLLA
jgi:hypothetical protein